MGLCLYQDLEKLPRQFKNPDDEIPSLTVLDCFFKHNQKQGTLPYTLLQSMFEPFRVDYNLATANPQVDNFIEALLLLYKANLLTEANALIITYYQRNDPRLAKPYDILLEGVQLLNEYGVLKQGNFDAVAATKTIGDEGDIPSFCKPNFIAFILAYAHADL